MSKVVRTEYIIQLLQGIIRKLPSGRVPYKVISDELKYATELLKLSPDDENFVDSESDINSHVSIHELSITDIETDFFPDNAHPLPHIDEVRYQPLELLGAGGQGVVRSVKDKCLGRYAALKILRSEFAHNKGSLHAFLREAQITSQLSHAGIVPIYDVGMLSDGSPYYLMRQIKGRSLKDIFNDLREIRRFRKTDNTTHILKTYTRRRLLEILVLASYTVGYAHSKGVLHRDIKPANIMVGSYGEVLVVDWGIAKIQNISSTDSFNGKVVLMMDDVADTQHGVIKGTPNYMSPEQAEGAVSKQGPWTDVYALGLILYEIITGVPARPPSTVEAVLENIKLFPLEAPEERRKQNGLVAAVIPEELERICMKALLVEREERYQNAESFAKALQSYLDGEEKRESSENKVFEAELKLQLASEQKIANAQLQREIQILSEEISLWMPIENKRFLWSKEDELKRGKLLYEEYWTDALSLYTQALGDDSENITARSSLAKMYLDQLLEAEQQGRASGIRQYEMQIKRLDDGSLTQSLSGKGTFLIETTPAGSSVFLHDYEEIDRQKILKNRRFVGKTPFSMPLNMGSYLFQIRKDDLSQDEIWYPVYMKRLGTWEANISFYPNIPKSMVFIPAGIFIYGGDLKASGSAQRQEKWVADYAISIYPVTAGSYWAFIQELHEKSPELASKHVPKVSTQNGFQSLWEYSSLSKGYIFPEIDFTGGIWNIDFPMRHVSRNNAEEYCKWLSLKENRPYRLPTEHEWEKAGRGVDGRFFPWGDTFDPVFCKMKDSREGKPLPEVVGSFTQDVSPYGVRDMAGGVIEWCSGYFDRIGTLGVQKGGFWVASEASCRLSRRFGAFPSEQQLFAGFRVAMDLSKSFAT